MKNFVTISLLLLFSAKGMSAPAHVQSGYGENFPATVGTVEFGVPGVPGQNVTEGSLLVLTFRSDNNEGNAITSVTSEPGSQTWTKAKAQLSVTTFWVEVWYLPDAPAGATTVTVAVGSPADQMRMVLDEYSGVAATDPIDGTPVSATGTSAAANPGDITTLTAGSLIHVGVGSDGNDDADTFTAGPDYTIHNLGGDPDGSDKTMTEHRVASTAGSYGTTMGNINDSWSGVAVAFKSAESGGTSTIGNAYGHRANVGTLRSP